MQTFENDWIESFYKLLNKGLGLKCKQIITANDPFGCLLVIQRSISLLSSVIVSKTCGESFVKGRRSPHTQRSSTNGVVASLTLGFKVPLFIGQGLLFLWAFSGKRVTTPPSEFFCR